MNKSIINRSMIIKSNTTFLIYTIVINDSKIFINKRESLRYLRLFSLAPLSLLRGCRAHSLPFWWSSISTVSWCWPDIMQLQRCIKVSSFINFLSWYQGRIQDLWLGGSWVGEGSGDRLRSPAVQGRALVGDQKGGEAPRRLWSLRNYRHLLERQFWTNHTIFIRPKNLTLSLNFVG